LDGVERPAELAARAQVLRRVTPNAGASTRQELEARVDDWIRRNPAEYEAQRRTFSQRYRDALSHTAENGKTYVYLGDQDSYAWVRLARNVLRHGTTCDAVVDGVCRDMLVNGSQGAELIYDRSLHISAIATLQRLLQRFDPRYPLTATAFWIPLIAGVLGVLPAFWIGYRLAGPVAAVGSALLTALHPVLLQRSIGSDNDIWNVVLPLYMVAAAIAGLLSQRTRGQIGWAVLAGACAGLHAMTWNGWVFAWAVLLVALVVVLLTLLLAKAIEAGRPRGVAKRPPSGTKTSRQTPRTQTPPSPEPEPLLATLRTPLLVLVSFLVASGLGATLAKPDASYLSTLWGVLRGLAPRAFLGEPATLELWPSVLRTVSELQTESTVSAAFPWPFGRLYCAASLIGLLWAIFPDPPWTRRQLVTLIGGGIWLGMAVSWGESSPLFVLAAAGLPFGVATMARAQSAVPAERAFLPPLLVIAIWFLAGFFAASRAARLVLLFTPGIGLALAIGLGRAHQRMSAALPGALGRSHPSFELILAVLLCVPFVPPVHAGYLTARNYLPAIDGAWWDTLTELRERAAPDAIVYSWWDYGYWVKYVAERRVSADGSMLLTHLPYWMGRALLSSKDRESAGLLRMLGCGSDATPRPEGERGAYGLLRAQLGDEIRAHAMVIELASRSRAEASAYLSDQGFDQERAEQVLAATHCQPPESYLLVGTELTARDSWMRLGAWDFQRSYIHARAAVSPESEVVADLTQRFGYGEEQARGLYRDAKRLHQVDFVIGSLPRAPSVWYPCRPGDRTGIMRCRLGLFDMASKRMVEELVYDVLSPGRSVVRYRHAEPGRPPGQVVEQAPGALLVAEAKLEDVALPTPRYVETGFLVDTRNWRVLAGPPLLIRSTFTHLLFLDGRYTRQFEKVGERVTHAGDRLQTWRVRFPEE
jgi:hypothetical protein